jgi:hypothetical protein
MAKTVILQEGEVTDHGFVRLCSGVLEGCAQHICETLGWVDGYLICHYKDLRFPVRLADWELIGVPREASIRLALYPHICTAPVRRTTQAAREIMRTNYHECLRQSLFLGGLAALSCGSKDDKD